MSKHIIQRGDADFVWSKEIEREDTTLLVFHQGEMGFSSFLAGMGLIGEEKCICRIFSKLHNVGAFNSAPEPTFPEWRLFQRHNVDGRRFFILRLTHAHPLPDSEFNDHTWLYTYPVVRDIVMELSERGVDELVYLTSNLLQSVGGYDDEYATLEDEDVAVYDYINHEENALTLEGVEIEKQIVLAAPSWTFACIFKNFCTNEIRGVWIAIGGRNVEDFIDTKTTDSLLYYCDFVLGLDNNKPKVEEYINVLNDFEHLARPFDLDRAMADAGVDDYHV